MDRVLYTQDKYAIIDGLGGVEAKFAYDYRAQSMYSNNCTSVLLRTVAELPSYGDQLSALVQWQFVENVNVHYYRAAFLPRTEYWGQHCAAFVNIENGRQTKVSAEKFKELKLKTVKERFFDGYERVDEVAGKVLKYSVLPMFDYHRAGRTELMLQERGVKREEWDKAKATKEFQDELDAGMEAAERRFIRGYLNASPVRWIAKEELKAFGLKEKLIQLESELLWQK
jgi:hypothetical protein